MAGRVRMGGLREKKTFHKNSMAEATARPPRVTVRKTRRTILDVPRADTTQVNAVAERGPWLAVATSSTGGAWSIRACHTASAFGGPQTAAATGPNQSNKPHLTRLASGTVGSPTWIDISSDGVLIAALRNGGLRLFMLVSALPPVFGCNFYELSCHSFPSVCYAKFIAPAADEASVVLSITDATTHTVALYKSPLSNHGSVQPLMKAPPLDITDVQASEPGKVVVLSRRHQCMYLLVMGDENMFCMRTMLLSQFDGLRPGVPHCTPTRVAIGDQLVAVGYCCTTPGHGGVNGLVEAFSLTTGDMVARRSMRGSHPTAMRTQGPRIVVGGASVRGGNEAANPLYIFGVHDAFNYSVANLTPGESWSSAKLRITGISWAYTQRLVVGSAREGSEVVWETVQASLSNAGST
jgi:hypothetical protein